MKKKLVAGAVSIAAALTMGSAAAFAMPGDIQEAVNDPSYNAWGHQNGAGSYADEELIAIDGTYVATANAMIRQAPFGEILGSTVPGQQYHVVGECPDCMWYKVSGDIEGYVYADYLVPEGDYKAETNSNSHNGYNVRSLDMYMLVDAYALNVRTAPSMDGAVIKSLPKDTEVHVTAKVLGTEWYECELDGQVVYMSDNYLKPELPQTMACTVDALNIRSGAGMEYAVIGTMHRGDKVKVSADENDWLKFSFEDGTVGYVYDEFMAVVA